MHKFFSGPRRGTLVFVGVVVLLAALLYFFTRGGTGRTALIQYGDPQKTMEVSLDKDADYDLDSNGYTVHLQVRDGTIAFVDSPCPDHLFEGFGRLSREGDWAACMPAQVSVTVQ